MHSVYRWNNKIEESLEYRLSIKTIDKVDTGSNISLGFDFKINSLNSKKEITNEQFKFSLGQIIIAEENRDMPAKSTLNEKMSDIIGETSLSFNENVKLTNNFLLDSWNKNLQFKILDSKKKCGSG